MEANTYSLSALRDAAREALAGFDPQRLSGDDAAVAVEVLADVEKLCAAARVRAAARAAECGAHRDRGHASPEQWLAAQAGVTAGRAKSELELAAVLDEHAATSHAVATGELSLDQAAEVVKTAQEVPEAEAELLDLARSGASLRTLKDQGRRRRLEHEDPDTLHRRRHDAMSFRHWTDDDGMVAGAFRLPPELGVPLVTRLEREADRIDRRSPKSDRHQRPHAWFAARALLTLADGTCAGRRKSDADLVLVVDYHAYRRGHLHPEDRCHIPGVGRVPLSVAYDLATDAFVKAVTVDGTKVETIRHFGRHLTAEHRTLLAVGSAPDFDGPQCDNPACDRRHGLERDRLLGLLDGYAHRRPARAAPDAPDP